VELESLVLSVDIFKIGTAAIRLCLVELGLCVSVKCHFQLPSHTHGGGCLHLDRLELIDVSYGELPDEKETTVAGGVRQPYIRPGSFSATANFGNRLLGHWQPNHLHTPKLHPQLVGTSVLGVDKHIVFTSLACR
jgi:hypothetical protein